MRILLCLFLLDSSRHHRRSDSADRRWRRRASVGKRYTSRTAEASADFLQNVSACPPIWYRLLDRLAVVRAEPCIAFVACTNLSRTRGFGVNIQHSHTASNSAASSVARHGVTLLVNGTRHHL